MLTKLDLQLLLQIYLGKSKISDLIAENRKKSVIYNKLKNLKKLGLINLNRSNLQLNQDDLALFLNYIRKYPNLINLLQGNNLSLFLLFKNPKTFLELTYLSGLSEPTISKFLKSAKKIGLIRQKDKYLIYNSNVWLDFYFVCQRFRDYVAIKEWNLPIDSKVYFVSNRKIVFSSIEDTNYKLTAYALWEKSIGTLTNYYTNEVDLNRDVIIILNSEDDYYLRFYALIYFYIKKISLSKMYLHNIIKSILNGQKVNNWPTKKAILEKVKEFDFKF